MVDSSLSDKQKVSEPSNLIQSRTGILAHVWYHQKNISSVFINGRGKKKKLICK